MPRTFRSDLQRDDAEPIKPKGKPLTNAQLIDLADITPQEISAAMDRFSASVPPRFQRLLD